MDRSITFVINTCFKVSNSRQITAAMLAFDGFTSNNFGTKFTSFGICSYYFWKKNNGQRKRTKKNAGQEPRSF